MFLKLPPYLDTTVPFSFCSDLDFSSYRCTLTPLFSVFFLFSLRFLFPSAVFFLIFRDESQPTVLFFSFPVGLFHLFSLHCFVYVYWLYHRCVIFSSSLSSRPFISFNSIVILIDYLTLHDLIHITAYFHRLFLFLIVATVSISMYYIIISIDYLMLYCLIHIMHIFHSLIG